MLEEIVPIQETAPVVSGQALPSVVSLFCGAGGLDLGFQQAGFQTILALDNDADAVASWCNIVGPNVASVADVETVDLTSKLEGAPNRIGVIGGPPCQGFSRARASADESPDPRRRFPKVFADACRELARDRELAFVVMENVAALGSSRHNDVLTYVTEVLAEVGLTCATLTLNSLNHGVPQDRERLFVIGLPPADASTLTVEQHDSSIRTVRDAIGALPSPNHNVGGSTIVEGDFHRNHVCSRPTSDRFSTKQFNRWRSFRRLAWDQPSPTVAYGNREVHVHPSGVRRLSVYEAMLLQGFPATAELSGNFSAQVRQVSNAVPPPLARAVAEAVRDVLSSPGTR